jgi:putative transposase
MKTNDIDSLNHTSWNCKYHIVFAPNTVEKQHMGKCELRLEKY